LQTVAAGARQKLAEPVERLRLSEAEKSLLTTITLGDRSRLPKEVRRRFAASGVAHVLSVSGFHIGVVCAALSLLFSVFPAGLFWRRLRYLGTLVLLWAFAFVSGLAPASVRAALMLSFYLSGLQFRRAPDSYNTLAAAAFCMLVYKPAYLFDIGFQLSYLSVLSILYFLPRLQGLLPLRNPLLRKPWQWLWLSVSAQLGVAFLCLYYFGQFSTVFLLANLPLTLLSTLLIPAALVWFLLPGIPFLQEAVEWLTHSMLWVVDTLGRLPGSSLSFHFGLTALLLSYTLLFFLWKLLSKHLPKQKSPLPEGGELL
jgi:competence protein ComEC